MREISTDKAGGGGGGGGQLYIRVHRDGERRRSSLCVGARPGWSVLYATTTSTCPAIQDSSRGNTSAAFKNVRSLAFDRVNIT